MEETFKDVIGYEGFYQISNLGRLKSLERFIKGRNNGKRLKPESIIKNKLDSKGYYHYELSKLGKKKDLRLHRLIAEVFIPNPELKPYINHKNGIKTDNSILNLEWVTQSENTQHAYDTGLMVGQKGKDHSSSKKIYQYDKCGNLISSFDGMRDAGRETGIEPSSIGKCAQGLRPSAGGYVWKYE